MTMDEMIKEVGIIPRILSRLRVPTVTWLVRPNLADATPHDSRPDET